MNQVKVFLEENRTLFFATVENGQPRVRPFGYMFMDGSRLIMCTANTKKVYAQLQKNLRIECTAMDKNFRFLRISGTVEFLDDMELKEQVLAASPLVKSIYSRPDNPVFEVFAVHPAGISMTDLMKQTHEVLL